MFCVRNRAAELQNSLGVACELSSFVKPGAGLSVITDTAEEIENLNNEDVVLWAGDNDVSKNNSKETMKHICNFVERRRKTYCDSECPPMISPNILLLC
jgi:hypothetical protein